MLFEKKIDDLPCWKILIQVYISRDKRGNMGRLALGFVGEPLVIFSWHPERHLYEKNFSGGFSRTAPVVDY